MGEAYRLNEPLVACEALEGDLILLNFESGYYYNVRGISAAICQHLFAGGTLAAAVHGLAAHYGIPAEQVQQEVHTFVEELVKEGLMIPSDTASAGHAMPAPCGPYEVPRCEKFDDMADQLLLDKIDDLSQDAQWATPAPAPAP
jgi:hypothetical protein